MRREDDDDNNDDSRRSIRQKSPSLERYRHCRIRPWNKSRPLLYPIDIVYYRLTTWTFLCALISLGSSLSLPLPLSFFFSFFLHSVRLYFCIAHACRELFVFDATLRRRDKIPLSFYRPVDIRKRKKRDRERKTRAI